jgi:hypothetical protein
MWLKLDQLETLVLAKIYRQNTTNSRLSRESSQFELLYDLNMKSLFLQLRSAT